MKGAKPHLLVTISLEATAQLKQGNEARSRKPWNIENRKHWRKVKGNSRRILKGDENQAWKPTN